MPFRNFFLGLILLLGFDVSAQRGSNIINLLDSLNYSDQLPEDLLSTKSLVLMKVPIKRDSPEVRGDWKALAAEVQPGFKKSGIDAVAYYYVDDVFSGPEAVGAFAEKFEERVLDNVIFVIEEDGTYEIIITEITDKNNLITKGQNAYRIEGNRISQMTHNIYLKGANSGLERNNLLIIEVPTFGDMAHAIEGRRGEYFDVNFKSFALAVPDFADTSKIKKVMADYPYDYVIVDSDKTERELRDEDHQYILYYVHTVGRNVKEILEYEINESESAYMSEVSNGETRLKSINNQTPVYKFYVKHIYSENVFLGTKWDADISWSDALHNYITNMENQLSK